MVLWVYFWASDSIFQYEHASQRKSTLLMFKREFSTHRCCLKLPFMCWSQHISGRFGQISCQWHLLATVPWLIECFISSFSSNLNPAQTVCNHALQVTQGGKYSVLKIHRFEQKTWLTWQLGQIWTHCSHKFRGKWEVGDVSP